MATRGGKRPGAGRPKGRKNDATLAREAVQKAIDQRVMRLADRLISAQLAAAEGVMFLFKRPRAGGKVERVTSESEIKRYLDAHGTADEAPADDGGIYYFLAAERPSADAADRLLNRTMGKPKEAVEVSGPGGGPIPHHVRVTVVRSGAPA